MEAAHTSARNERSARAQDGARKCLVTGEVRPKDELIRFVVSPDHRIVPDLAQNLPGRGLWVTASRDTLETAVRKNLFARAAKAPAEIDAGLADQVVALLRKRCLDFIGMGRRAGLAVLGQPQVEAALKGKKLTLLLLADDAKSEPAPASAGVDVCRVFTRDELGAALGHDQIVYAGLKPHVLTSKTIVELARLEKIVVPHHIHQGNKKNND
jgi:predicted RNA-binding protein YlxR (DUF448 family)